MRKSHHLPSSCKHRALSTAKAISQWSDLRNKAAYHICAINSGDHDTGLNLRLCIEVLGKFLIFGLEMLTGRTPVGIKFHKDTIAAGLTVHKASEIILCELKRLTS